jgi:FkbM family methyltransferase
MNVRANHLESVHVMPFGLSDRFVEAARLLSEKGGLGNAAVLEGSTGGPTEHRITHVQLQPLDAVTLPAMCVGKRCSLIKLDIEGHEMSALAGAESFIASHRPLIYGEFSRWWFERASVPPDEPLRWSINHGYQCYELRERHASPLLDRRAIDFVPLTPGTSRTTDNLVLLPE